jgi:alkylhydroperoxidase/carboxymuconolactone decarboxylase family protein YurZ
MKMGEVPGFLRILEEKSPDFGEAILRVFEKEQSEGALPAKVKTLISMALDAAMGHPEGVKALAEKAREQGATEEEIIETIQVVTVACGIQGLATGSAAFK